MTCKIFSLVISFLFLGAAHGERNASLYTNGWIYIPGIDRSITECLVIELEDGEVQIELFSEDAPNHVARIKELATSGSYDQVAFHRVIDGFMAQTGDVQYGKINEFNSTLVGTGSSSLPDLSSEFNNRPHLRGTCSMARSSDPNSANSQFFICLENSTFLDRQYTIWGQVMSGMEFVDRIKLGDNAQNGKVSDPDAMQRVYVRTFQHDKISGWLYSNKEVYPYFYDLSLQAWLYFDESSEEPRFYDYSSGQWLSI